MLLNLVTPPAVDPVSLSETKDHIHVDHEHEDARLLGYIRTATRKLDGQSGLLGRCLIAQTWRLTLDRFSHEIVLPLPPCLSISRIAHLNPDGIEVDVSPTAYRVTGLGTLDGARISAARGATWPNTFDTDSAFIEFTAGFGANPSDVPEPLRTAILMHVGHLYEHRESVMLGTGFIAEVPHGYESLIRDYRLWSF